MLRPKLLAPSPIQTSRPPTTAHVTTFSARLGWNPLPLTQSASGTNQAADRAGTPECDGEVDHGEPVVVDVCRPGEHRPGRIRETTHHVPGSDALPAASEAATVTTAATTPSRERRRDRVSALALGGAHTAEEVRIRLEPAKPITAQEPAIRSAATASDHNADRMPFAAACQTRKGQARTSPRQRGCARSWAVPGEG
jgi:hypothetical protein